MKYAEGNTVLLNDGRTAYIMSVYKTERKYLITIIDDNQGEAFKVLEREIMMKLT